MNTTEVERLIGERFKKTGNYAGMYREHARLAEYVWNDTERKDYQADVWYNRNRNEICLEMLGDLAKDKKVLSVGGGHWAEGEFLKTIGAGELIRTDIVASDGVMEADAANLPFNDKNFEIVICREVIEHVPDDQKVFDELKRVLKKGGYLLITTPNAYTLNLDGVFHVRLFTPITFLNALIEQGYTIIEKRGNLPYIFQGLMAYSSQGFELALEEFKQMERITRDYPERYYLSTQLFVLCQKGE